MTTWYYKGLKCTIENNRYKIYDIGIITRELHLLYTGILDKEDKKMVETLIDTRLKPNPNHFTYCNNYISAVEKGYCCFNITCCNDCLFNRIPRETFNSLQDKFDILEDKYDKLKSAIDKLAENQ